jgi:hypothetical protein
MHSSLQLSKFRTVHILWCFRGHLTNQHWWKKCKSSLPTFFSHITCLYVTANLEVSLELFGPDGLSLSNVFRIDVSQVPFAAQKQSLCEDLGSSINRFMDTSELHRRLSILFFMELRRLCHDGIVNGKTVQGFLFDYWLFLCFWCHH